MWPDQEQTQEDAASFLVLTHISRSCTFPVFMGLTDKIKNKILKNQGLEGRLAKEQDLESGMEIHQPMGLVNPASELSA